MFHFPFLTHLDQIFRRRPSSGSTPLPSSDIPVKALVWSAAIAALGGAGFGFYIKAQWSTAILMPRSLNGIEARPTIQEPFPPKTPTQNSRPPATETTSPAVVDSTPSEPPPETLLSEVQTLSPLTEVEPTATAVTETSPSTSEEPVESSLGAIPSDPTDLEPDTSADRTFTDDLSIYPPPVENPPDPPISESSLSVNTSSLNRP